jgi:predicted porin
MKKSLIALAVLGAFTGAAFAQSTVTLYGSIDLGIEKLPGKSVRVSNNEENNGRIGFKGVEDLGGGLKASFVVETGISGDKAGFSSNGGLAAIGNRATWLSLGTAKLGTVSMGRGYSGNFFTQLWADNTINAYGQGGGGAVLLFANVDQTRYDNVIRYQSPNLAGFTADVGVGLLGDGQSDLARPAVDAATGAPTRNLSSATEAGYTATFAYGGLSTPIYAAIGFTKAPGRPVPGATALNGLAANNDQHVVTAAAGYNFGVVRISGSFEHDNRYRSNANAWFVSAGVPLGAGKVMAYYGQDDNGGITLSDKFKQASIAYSYNLSKRTDWYVAVSNDNVSGTPAAGKPKAAGAVGFIDGTSVQIGLDHHF